MVSLFQEIDDFDDKQKAERADAESANGADKRRRVSDMDKTSLRHYVQYFETSFLGPLLEHHAIERGARSDRDASAMELA